MPWSNDVGDNLNKWSSTMTRNKGTASRLDEATHDPVDLSKGAQREPSITTGIKEESVSRCRESVLEYTHEIVRRCLPIKPLNHYYGQVRS